MSSQQCVFSDCLWEQSELLDEVREIDPERFQDLYSIFIAPEVSEDNAVITKAVDVWSVGIIAIEMIYGDFKRLSKESAIEIDGLINPKKFMGREGNFEEIYGWIPSSLLHLLKKCLVTSPEQRITVLECLDLPFFRDVKMKSYLRFLKENPEIGRVRKNILDLSRIKADDDLSPSATQSVETPLNPEAEKNY